MLKFLTSGKWYSIFNAKCINIVKTRNSTLPLNGESKQATMILCAFARNKFRGNSPKFVILSELE